ncbi:hypothetical protein BJ741DRAFT_660579 [Chytriomyces cf. hyalinus JEL632]|nr:hypothetical protein BJ741DRAFT_660579 [Chytriomyces cf. hyalinus JEL632]
MITTAAVFDLSKHSITATPSPRFNSINCYQPCANWIPNIILWLYDDCTPCFRYGSKSRWRCSYIIGRNTTSSAATSAPSTYSSAAPLRETARELSLSLLQLRMMRDMAIQTHKVQRDIAKEVNDPIKENLHDKTLDALQEQEQQLERLELEEWEKVEKMNTAWPRVVVKRESEQGPFQVQVSADHLAQVSPLGAEVLYEAAMKFEAELNGCASGAPEKSTTTLVLDIRQQSVISKNFDALLDKIDFNQKSFVDPYFDLLASFPSTNTSVVQTEYDVVRKAAEVLTITRVMPTIAVTQKTTTCPAARLSESIQSTVTVSEPGYSVYQSSLSSLVNVFEVRTREVVDFSKAASIGLTRPNIFATACRVLGGPELEFDRFMDLKRVRDINIAQVTNDRTIDDPTEPILWLSPWVTEMERKYVLGQVPSPFFGTDMLGSAGADAQKKSTTQWVRDTATYAAESVGYGIAHLAVPLYFTLSFQKFTAEKSRAVLNSPINQVPSTPVEVF